MPHRERLWKTVRLKEQDDERRHDRPQGALGSLGRREQELNGGGAPPALVPRQCDWTGMGGRAAPRHSGDEGDGQAAAAGVGQGRSEREVERMTRHLREEKSRRRQTRRRPAQEKSK